MISVFYLSVRRTRVCGHVHELCKNGWTNRDAVWGMTHMGPRNRVLDGVQIPEGEENIWGLPGPLSVTAALYASKNQ